MEAIEGFFIDPGFIEPWQQKQVEEPLNGTFLEDELGIFEGEFSGEFRLQHQVSGDSQVFNSPEFHQDESQIIQFSPPSFEVVKGFEELVLDQTIVDVDESITALYESDSSSSSSQAPSAGRDDLLTMLQRCIATHITTATAATTRKVKMPATEEKELVAGLQKTIMKRKRRHESPALSALMSARTYVRAAMSRDVMSLLHDCAYAVATRDVAAASDLAVEIRRRHGAAPLAASSQLRVAYFFTEALMARALGTGRGFAAAAAAATAGGAATTDMETIYAFRIHHTPSPVVPHFFSTQAILRAIAKNGGGGGVVHIIDIGMARNRFQWSLLLHALAIRPPKKLRITAFDAPQHRSLLEQLGRRIISQATDLGIVSVEYGSTLYEPGNWEAGISRVVSGLNELVIVNALFSLDWLGDESAVWARSRRRGMLASISKLHPDLVILGVNDGRIPASSEMSFLDRFCQAVRRFGAKFDYSEECTSGVVDDPGRLAYEGKFLAPEIVNLVACDGEDRMVRTSPYEEWSTAMEGCGFEMEDMDPETFSRAQSMIRDNFNRHFEVESDNGWMKLSWKKITTQCMSSWILK